MVDKVNVLGTTYTITIKTSKEDPTLEKCDGYCDCTTRQIVIADLSDGDDGDWDVVRKQITRHEIVHAFLFESGLGFDAFASMNIETAHPELIVDWIARQAPKLFDTFNAAQAI